MKLTEMFSSVDKMFRDTYLALFYRYFDPDDKRVGVADVLEKFDSERIYEEYVQKHFWTRSVDENFRQLMLDMWDIEVRSYHLEDIWSSFLKKLSMEHSMIRSTGRGQHMCSLFLSCIEERFIDRLDNHFQDKFSASEEKSRNESIMENNIMYTNGRENNNNVNNNVSRNDEKHFVIPDHVFQRRAQPETSRNENNNILSRREPNMVTYKKPSAMNNENVDLQNENFDDLFRVVNSSKKRTRSRDF